MVYRERGDLRAKPLTKCYIGGTPTIAVDIVVTGVAISIAISVLLIVVSHQAAVVAGVTEIILVHISLVHISH